MAATRDADTMNAMPRGPHITPLAVAGGIGAALSAGAAYSLMQASRTPHINPDTLWGDTADRHAVVYGVGGISGAVWQAGIIQWLEQHDIHLRDAPLTIGTSAGSLVSALARTRLTTDQIVHLAANGTIQLDGITVNLPTIDPGTHDQDDNDKHDERDDRRRDDSLIGRGRNSLIQPLRAIGSGRFPSLASTVAGLLPTGRFSLDDLAEALDFLWWRCGTNTRWPTPATWIVAVDLYNGQRVCFGADGEPDTTCGLAVAASCAVPGILEPVTIGSRRYVDGGVASFTNIDLAISAHATRITVLNPVGTERHNIDNTLVGRGEALLRRTQTRSMHRAVERARDHGITVDIHVPTQDELDAMGDRLLDFTRATNILDTISRRSAPHSTHPQLA